MSRSRRIINWINYPMVVDNSGYINTCTKLPCKCQGCDSVIEKTIRSLDKSNGCYCRSCARKYKTKKTLFEKYGDENYFNKEKFEKTNIIKRGVPYPTQSKCVKEKIINQNLKNYGVENVSQSEIIKSKKKETNINKRGIPNPAQKNRTIEQIEITLTKENFEKYLRTFSIKPTTKLLSKLLGYSDKSTIQTLLKKWDLYSYVDVFTSIGELYVSNIVAEMGLVWEKKRFKYFEIDVFIPELNIGFEYNGLYWHSYEHLYKVYKSKKELKEYTNRYLKNNPHFQSYFSGSDDYAEVFANNYHYFKTNMAERKGIKLYHICESEFISNPTNISVYIRDILKKSGN